MTTDQTIEAEIQAKGLNAPRVTPADVEANIIDTEIVKHVSLSGQILRWAVITTRSGFAVVGDPSCSVSSENDDAAIGEKVAIANSRGALWPLMGYELRTRLSPQPAAASTFQDRVRAERAELDERLDKLVAFRSTDTFAGLPVEEQERLDAQRAAMTDYSNTLHERIAAFESTPAARAIADGGVLDGTNRTTSGAIGQP